MWPALALTQARRRSREFRSGGVILLRPASPIRRVTLRAILTQKSRATEQTVARLSSWMGTLAYSLRRRRSLRPATATRPVPSKIIVAGSGTG